MRLGGSIVDGLKHSPWVLGLVVVNVLFLGYVVHEAGASGERRDQLIAELAKNCRSQ